MRINETPKVNMDRSETGCCPRFNPEPWDEQTFVFDNKLFVTADTKSFLRKSKGKTMKKIYFFYTTCPKCAKYFGKKLCSCFY